VNSELRLGREVLLLLFTVHCSLLTFWTIDMPEKITVFVNGAPVELYRGMHVKHALISCDYSLYKAVEDGRAMVEDANGFRLGLDGALRDGARIFVVSRPPRQG